MDLRSQFRTMLEELENSSPKTIFLCDKHVSHLSLTADNFMRKHAYSEVISIALPPIVCHKRYHYAHVYIQSGIIEYRGAEIFGYPQLHTKGRVREPCGDFCYYIDEAIQYADENWGEQLFAPTIISVTAWVVLERKSKRQDKAKKGGEIKTWVAEWENGNSYSTTSRCEALELCLELKVKNVAAQSGIKLGEEREHIYRGDNINAQPLVVTSLNKAAPRVEVKGIENVEASQCSNAYKNGEQKVLEEWYEKYMEGNYDNIVYDDDLDTDIIEKQITNSKSNWTQEAYCFYCQRLLDNWGNIVEHTSTPGAFYDIQHNESTIELEASSRIGCNFCTLLVLCIQGTDMMAKFRKIEGRLKKLNKSTKMTLSVTSDFFHGLKGGNTKYTLVAVPGAATNHRYIYVNSPGRVSPRHSLIPRLIVQHAIAPNPFSERENTTYIDSTHGAISTAKQWLTECSETHSKCKNNGQYQLPTRLVYVKGGCTRLVLTSEWTVKPRYATLSHCWGELKFLTLSKASLEQFVTMIPVDALSKTFRDAIDITRQLGLEYIWIDSLCIIQDDREDWEQEAPRMSAIYGGSFINIAAAEAVNGNGGCFPPKPLYYNSRIVHKYQAKGISRYCQIFEDSYERSVSSSNLAKRAWVLQERLLATRTLHFGPLDVFWECEMREASESFPEQLPDKHKNKGISYNQKTLASMWKDIVSLYSRANLSHSSDKLVALSGIARAVQEDCGDQYIAGLWRRNMERQLCWSSLSACKPRPKEYRAPSWSWLSLDTECSYIYVGYHGVRDVHVLEASVTPARDDPLVELSNGSLKLAYSVMLYGYLYTENKVKLGSAVTSSYVTITLSNGSIFRLDARKDHSNIENGAVFVLPVTKLSQVKARKKGRERVEVADADRWDSEHFDKIAIEGLLLQPTAISRGQYYRVGYFYLSWEVEERCKKYTAAIDESGVAIAASARADIPLDVTDSTYPNHRFVITII